MDHQMSTQEMQLCQHLIELPRTHGYRFEDAARRDLLFNLFWSLAGGKPEHMRLLFPDGRLDPKGVLKLTEAQGAVEGAEYTDAARGKACGHIFRAGEATYSCRTCSTDDTCCLCSKCFESTDHAGHMVKISISPGNSGCCDCGDPEAWNVPMVCTIHTEREGDRDKGKGTEPAALPLDLVKNIRMTISRVLDFTCDVISCAPEQLRQPKTKESIQQDERMSRLNSTYCGGDKDSPEEYALLLWNDEKHTIYEVQEQVARACKTSMEEGFTKGFETDAVGRSLLKYSTDIDELLKCSVILEQIKITVTIRSSRDIFRELMCGTMIEWLNDIAGCMVGNDGNILRMVICEELLKPWRRGSPGTHAITGKDGIADEEKLEHRHEMGSTTFMFFRMRNRPGLESDDDEDDMDDGETASSGEAEDVDDDDNDEDDEADDDDDVMMVDTRPETSAGDVAMTDWRQGPIGEALEEEEATMAGYPPPPPPPPPVPRRTTRDRDLTPSDSDTAEPLIAPSVYAKTNLEIPKTPGVAKSDKTRPPKPGRYWLETPAGYGDNVEVQPFEDVFQRVRLDYLILFDLRMWKKVRNDLRSLYISTVVTIPEFKRILGLRFSALYTTLAQLYLIGDREPDHSIINISLQMLTTPSITAEVVERGNFLTTLMAILYTFLTTRQVGHPWEVSSSATLGFDTGSVTNRRMYHFYVDMKFLLGSPHVQERLRTEERYLLQFLDLVKLHQGICPNTRAVGEHVEYETDNWIGASLMTREINKLCRLIAGSFKDVPDEDSHTLSRAIRLTAKAVIINSVGAERSRFTLSEIKDEIRFKNLTDFEFAGTDAYHVPRFTVEEQAISFHHALHYTLSWLIECGKGMSAQQLKSVLSFNANELKLKPKSMGRKNLPKREYSPEDYLVAAFDYPLRVCTWLAQIKASMWVRNGISLRHQAVTYRNILHRDVTHARDIFLLQTAMVVCDPSRILAATIDRYGMERWIKGLFGETSTAQDETQQLDVVEDMIHLLIVLLSDRISLIPVKDEQETQLMAMRRDVTHVLCFRPMSFNEVCSKLPEKFHEQDEFYKILDEVATFKAPEGTSDTGTFELRPQFIENIDPYIAHYNKNQREESEAAYRKWMANKTGKPAAEIVYEPKIQPITSGAFVGLADFTGTGMFAQVIYYSLLYTLVAKRFTPKVPFFRIETFLQVVLHLILIAVAEDRGSDSDVSEGGLSFLNHAMNTQARSNFMSDAPASKTIVSLLEMISTEEQFKACHPKIGVILRRMRQKMPSHFDSALLRLGIPVDRLNTASPASNNNEEEQRELKKKAALERQAKVMAQFQQQQKSFLEMQGDVDWGDEELDDVVDDPNPTEERKNFWKYPRSTCILCQEDTDDGRLYGTFALFEESKILRQTDFQDADFVREAAKTPGNLDRSAEAIRPFGLAHENRKIVEKIKTTGEKIQSERQGIGKGFPAKLCRSGPVAVGCGHIMHYSCFELYIEATVRRHGHQIARHHPENLERLEFVCPLCKALGNSFLPIPWEGKEEAYPGILQSDMDFASFLENQSTQAQSSYPFDSLWSNPQLQGVFSHYMRTKMPNSHLASFGGSSLETWDTGSSNMGAASTPSTSAFDEAFSVVATPESSGGRSRTSPEPSSGDKELLSVYKRIRDTLCKNGLAEKPVSGLTSDGDLYGSDALVQSVGYSISAAEIQQRGMEAQYEMTLVERIPEHTLVQLRILCETAASYISIGGLKSEHCADTFRRSSERQSFQLFPVKLLNRVYRVNEEQKYAPLLNQDTFIFLCESLFGLGAVERIDTMHLVRLCYLAELVKVVHLMSRNMHMPDWIQHISSEVEDSSLDMFKNFCNAITHMGFNGSQEFGAQAEEAPNQAFNQPMLQGLENLRSFVSKYALTFLRKTAILLHIHCGVDLNSHIAPTPEADELTRLTAALRLPSLDDMFAVLTPFDDQYGWPACTKDLVTDWIRHAIVWPQIQPREYVDTLPSSARVSHPGIFELVGLPKNFDTLIEECAKRRCPKTGKDLADPVVCLMCGEIFCGQTMCCLMEVQEESEDKSVLRRIGGAQQHMRYQCQGTIGLYINIRKCAVFYLHRVSGSFSNAPYIDKWGETDIGLRHGRQLYLNQRRYDSMVRNLWLSHGIPSFISRRLESDINNGGWETI